MSGVDPGRCLLQDDRIERLRNDVDRWFNKHEDLEKRIDLLDQVISKFKVYAAIGAFVLASIGGIVINSMMGKLLQ